MSARNAILALLECQSQHTHLIHEGINKIHMHTDIKRQASSDGHHLGIAVTQRSEALGDA